MENALWVRCVLETSGRIKEMHCRDIIWKRCQRGTEDELPFLRNCCLEVKKKRVCLCQLCLQWYTKDAHTVKQNLYHHKRLQIHACTQKHSLTYTTNFPHTHIYLTFTDSDYATFEKGVWVCWLETSCSDPTQSPLIHDITLTVEPV